MYVMENVFRYNYVILGSQWELYKLAFSDVTNLQNVKYISYDVFINFTNSHILNKLHFSGHINKYINLPYKSIWNRYYLNFTFNNNKPICFVLFGGWDMLNYSCNLSRFLKQKYKGCKVVSFNADLYSLKKDMFTGKSYDFNKYSNLYDKIFSYDKGDCLHYGFSYHSTVMSKIDIDDEPDCEKSDVLYISKYKGRLELLIKIYDRLSSAGIKCDFEVLGVPHNLRKGNIKYIDKMLSYKDVLKRVKHTKCVLELMQSGADGFTYRTWESIIYKKLLITNNQSISNAPFYNPNFMFIITDEHDISEETIQCIKSTQKIEYKNDDLLSPKHLLLTIDNSI